jgi:hypothetical protein
MSNCLRLKKYVLYLLFSAATFVGCAMVYSTGRSYPFLQEMKLPSITDSIERTMVRVGYQVEAQTERYGGPIAYEVSRNKGAHVITGQKTMAGKRYYLSAWVRNDRGAIFAEGDHSKDVTLFLDTFKDIAQTSVYPTDAEGDIGGAKEPDSPAPGPGPRALDGGKD